MDHTYHETRKVEKRTTPEIDVRDHRQRLLYGRSFGRGWWLEARSRHILAVEGKLDRKDSHLHNDSRAWMKTQANLIVSNTDEHEWRITNLSHQMQMSLVVGVTKLRGDEKKKLTD